MIYKICMKTMRIMNSYNSILGETSERGDFLRSAEGAVYYIQKSCSPNDGHKFRQEAIRTVRIILRDSGTKCQELSESLSFFDRTLETLNIPDADKAFDYARRVIAANIFYSMKREREK